MESVKLIMSSEAKETLKNEPIYEELLKVLNNCMFIDSCDSKTKIMYRDFNYLLIAVSKKDSSSKYLCPGLFDSSVILSPIYIAGDDAILGKVPIGGVASPCNTDNIIDNFNEFNASSIYTHIVKMVIVLDELSDECKLYDPVKNIKSLRI